MDNISNTSINYSADKLGYYQVGDFKTYQKHRAIEYSRLHGGFPEWHFNDLEYSNLDWKSCPTTSLEDLYRHRAEQLRNRYDYLVLFYSGGSDSQNILDICLKYNIIIDEIVCCHSLEGDGSTQAYFNAEIFNVAIPFLHKIKSTIPHTKITFIDQTQAILSDFTDSEWFWSHNMALTPNCVVRSKIREWHPHFKQLIDNGTKVGFVWGRDKPKLFLDENKRFYTLFDDNNDNNTSAYSQNQSGWYDEFFYQDPASTDIIVRQCHEIVNRILEDSIPDSYCINEFIVSTTEYGTTKSGKKISNNGIACMLYPSWKETTFSNGKNPSMIYGARDRWFFQDYSESNAYKNWKQGIDKLERFLKNIKQHEYYWLNTDDMFDNIVGCRTKRYYIT